MTSNLRQQVWAIWTGSGSNGKSLLMSMLMALLGPFGVTMPGELLFETGKTTAGACTPHLQCLIKKRMGFKDEGRSDKTNVLNEECIKTVTGSTSIATKPLYREYIFFQPSHLPVLLCNKRPRINIRDDAMMRRIVVIPFDNIYTTRDSKQIPYDSTNPHHRLCDFELRGRLLSEEGQRQFLTWLVRGARAWYGSALGVMPGAVGAAFDSYREENDHLSAFIADRCTVSPQLEVSASDFRHAYLAYSSLSVKQKDLRDQMSSIGHKYNSKTGVYRGISIKVEG